MPQANSTAQTTQTTQQRSAVTHVVVTYCATRYPRGHEKDGDAQAQPRKVKLVGVSRVVVRCRHAHRRRDVVVEASNAQTQLEPSVASRGRNSPSAEAVIGDALRRNRFSRFGFGSVGCSHSLSSAHSVRTRHARRTCEETSAHGTVGNTQLWQHCGSTGMAHTACRAVPCKRPPRWCRRSRQCLQPTADHCEPSSCNQRSVAPSSAAHVMINSVEFHLGDARSSS